MAGALYIWILAAFFVGTVGVMLLLALLFWIGHKFENKHTGTTHAFLEAPQGSQSHPVSSDTLESPPSTPSQASPPIPPHP